MSAIEAHLARYGRGRTSWRRFPLVPLLVTTLTAAAVALGVTLYMHQAAGSSPAAAKLASALPQLGLPIAAPVDVAGVRVYPVAVRRDVAKWPGNALFPAREEDVTVVRLRIENLSPDTAVRAFTGFYEWRRGRFLTDANGHEYAPVGIMELLGNDAGMSILPGEPRIVELAFHPVPKGVGPLTLPIAPSWFGSSGADVPLTIPAP